MNKLVLFFMLFLAMGTQAAKVEQVFVVSKYMKKKLPVTVVLPDSYDGKKSFKQIYLLHGAGGDHMAWHKKVTDLRPYADNLQRIIICPTAGKKSWYNPHNKSENYIIKEVIPAIDKKYKTEDDRWITGFSMGGFGSFRLGFEYPDLFSMIGGQSACITPSKWTHKWNIKSSMGPTAAEGAYDLFTEDILKKLASDKRPLSILCGKKDFFFKENLKAYNAVKAVRPDTYWLDMAGAHSGKYWKVSLKKTLEFFANQEKK